ncbi:MAG TPA: hypothetical protein VLB80_04530 [Candidatus Babeliales bacterium]|nr:hypothetical protein [Candidatus Babeliales bacterium]
MKIIRTIYLLITLAFATQVSNSFCMHNIMRAITKGAIAAACSSIELLFTFSPLANATLLNPADLRAKNLKNVQSNAPESIINFVTHIAKEKEINDVKVILNDKAYSYNTDTNKHIIFIPNKEATDLELLLAKTTLTSEEEEQLNRHKSILYHEIAHNIRSSNKYVPMYEASIGTVGGITTSALLTRFTHKLFPTFKQHFALKNTLKMARGGVTFFTIYNIMNMNFYAKYEELKADDGIPSQKKVLQAHINDSKKRHEAYLECINIIKERASLHDIILSHKDDQFTKPQLFAMKILPKNCFAKPLVMDIVFHMRSSHPSDLRRIHRLEKKI